MRLPRLALLCALVLAPLAVVAPSQASGWTPRPADYAGTAVQRDLPIRMSDGTILRGDLTVPADASGTAVPGRWPVVVTPRRTRTPLAFPAPAPWPGPGRRTS